MWNRDEGRKIIRTVCVWDKTLPQHMLPKEEKKGIAREISPVECVNGNLHPILAPHKQKAEDA
jgi:hypothetical protein